MTNRNSPLINAFLVFFVGLCSLWFFLYSHESVHKNIFRYDGIESEIQYDYYIYPAATMPEENCITESCWTGHNVTEAIGYQLAPILVFLIFVSSVSVMYLTYISNLLIRKLG